ncbi:MAG TPA: SEC-C metal-binding domain-containing protein [Polyangia bacterium]|jgi:hypothetical protein|nr:SEC-C metal-binding domain-containing protein [Polyangia bacterium]
MSLDDPESDDLVTHHGHDRHFLERLERVHWRETDVALRLYHEPALVRMLLDDPSVSERAERLAIAIAPGQTPPHVLVTRGGRFITCLGAGMDIGNLPVLTWERVESHLQRVDRSVSRLERALTTFREHDAEQLARMIVDSGARLRREEFQKLAAIAPIIHRPLFRSMVRVFDSLRKTMPFIARIKRPHTEVSLLRGQWNAMHRLGHLLLLTSHDGRRSFADIESGFWSKRDLFQYIYGYIPILAYGPVVLRVLWALGRAGKLALPSLKRMIADPERDSVQTWCIPALGLMAIAMRHQRLRAEALGAISVARMPEALRETDWGRQFVSHIHKFAENGPLNGSYGPVERQGAARILAGSLMDELTGRPRREHTELELDELALPRIANFPCDFYSHPVHVRTLLVGVAALAARPAEEFYFPAAHVDEAPAFTPEAALAMAESYRPGDPVRAEEKPGRNEPCPCGSGKKYKKCCGLAE